MVSSFTESRCAESAVAATAAAAAPTSSWPRLRCWLRGAAAWSGETRAGVAALTSPSFSCFFRNCHARQQISRSPPPPSSSSTVCQPQCKHGECVGPNKCKCHPGYAGKTCSQDEHSYPAPLDQGSEQPLFQPLDPQATSLPSRDLNECGLKPRPCKHRCMNTYGSYKCYCLNGYMLMPDGSCSNVDECATGRVSCPRFRQCVNTFGSYICKCHKGFDLMYIGGKYQCHDIDECSLGQYQCSSFAHCFNVHGSYKCKCKDGYHGDGLSCVWGVAGLQTTIGPSLRPPHTPREPPPLSVTPFRANQLAPTHIPKVMIEPSGPIHAPKGNGTISKGDGGHSNWIPDVGSTRWPLRTPYIPPVVTNRPTSKPTTRPTPKPTTWPTPPPPPPPPTELRRPPPPPTPERPIIRLTTVAPAATTSPREITVDNRIQTDPQKPRGDVFKSSGHATKDDSPLSFHLRLALLVNPHSHCSHVLMVPAPLTPAGASGAVSRSRCERRLPVLIAHQEQGEVEKP
ncbi:hypothetical protein QTO34_008144 [Cnephaeus nilssonii]|uniref:EGF-like domain-containing protein n=1 Tax=Cnephaeus nilssonii TaxID=3371016 RepID=A0AA40IB15_CNENI|nr:hypothetical protein QTO34_008144 [Eptesicus nilssonii]